MTTRHDPIVRPLRAGLLAVTLAVTGCVPGGHATRPSAALPPAFDPLAFFQGRTWGTGVLHILFRHPAATDVRGVGVVAQDDGGIVLDQDVTQGGGTPRHRRWVLRRVGPDRYAGTLTDAIGPVTAQTHGGEMRIRFAMKGGLKVEQRLDLQPGGQVALNVMTVRKLGIVVARLDERIERRP